jgi:hypothetical protein
MTKTALYRHYDAGGALLYVGVSLCAVARLSQHMASSSWATDIERIDVQWFKSRDAALAAERNAIQAERPVYNVKLGERPARRYPRSKEKIKYPQELITKIGGAANFAERASIHPDAPRQLTRDAVYMWQQRDLVPYMWRAVVKDIASGFARGDAA